MTSGRRYAWLGATWTACALLTGCNALDPARLLPRPEGSYESGPPPLDAGADPSLDADIDEAGSSHDAGPPDGHFDAASNEDAAGGEDASGDAMSGDAAVDGGDDGGGNCAEAGTTDYCLELLELTATPVVDGVLDCGPQLAPMTPTAWNGAAALPSGHRTQVAFAHRTDGLYLYIEVRGQSPVPHPSESAIYCGDAIEVYLDADGAIASDGAYDAPGTMQLIVAAPASSAAPNKHGERFVGGATQGGWTSTQYEIAWLQDGYALEAFVAAADLGLSSWSPATAIGLDVVIDVAGPEGSPDLGCGRQLGQYFLRVSPLTPSDCGGEPWCDARAFCLPALR